MAKRKAKSAPVSAPVERVVLAAVRLRRLNDTQRAAALERAQERLKGKHYGQRDAAIVAALAGPEKAAAD
ncbi:MAG TPA: hypothetical protein VKS60_12165 [Stellaceae bacterium]|nr:hypothetical protein [Stellaceae bacterium]